MRIESLAVVGLLALAACTPAGGSTDPDSMPRQLDGMVLRDAMPPPDAGAEDALPGDMATPPPEDGGVEEDGAVVEPDDGVEADMGGPKTDMAPPPDCETDDDCDDGDRCTVDTCVDLVCQRERTPGCCTFDDDCGAGGRCLEHLSLCAEPGGAVLFTEIHADPDAVGDDEGEWLEILNVSGADVRLDGWQLQGANGESHDFPNDTLLPLDARWVLARNGDAMLNGGVAVDYVYAGLSLTNGGDRVALVDALGDLVDEVVYDDRFDLRGGATLSLDPSVREPGGNDDPAAWCAGADPWADGADRGTPGAENPPCPDTTVDWCRLQFPLDLVDVEAGVVTTVYGRVYEAGITDRSDATDPDDGLRAQLGYGADGSAPGGEWTWIDAVPNAGYDAAGDGGEPNNDEYQAALAIAELGAWDFAFRFTRDDGETWTYCDRAAGDGMDGSEDGYQADRAGQISVVAGPPHPAAGEVVVTEIMFDTAAPLAENKAEWIELQNVSDERRSLGGCALADMDNEAAIAGGVLAPGEVALFARSADPALNGGLEVDGTFGFALGNNGDAVALRCDDVVVDLYAYDQPAPATSLQRDPEGRWCHAVDVYFEDEAVEGSAHRGTPGAANPACPAPASVDWCAHQFPEVVSAQAGAELVVYGVVREEGLTDLTPMTDDSPRLEAEAGVGPDGTDPVAGGWQWVAGLPNPGWNGDERGHPDDDEYQATLTVPEPGEYDLAWRFRLDGGAWTYCDLSPGSEDGYQAESAGALTALERNACDPNPCNAPPADACDGPGARLVYQTPGGCVEGAEEAECTYEAVVQPCDAGLVCNGGACVVPPPPAGAVRFTEVMYDPHDPLSDADAEWFELGNLGDAAYQLDGCVITDDGGARVALGPQLIEPGEHILFVRDADPEANGGLVSLLGFRFGLGNNGDDLALTCGAVEVDRVTYGVGGEWPRAQRYSISLDPVAPDEGAASWCRVRPEYFEGHHGTPGNANPPCDEPVDWCRFQHPQAAEVVPGEALGAYVRFFEEGLTDRSSAVDGDELVRVELGFGPFGSDPRVDDGWTWLDALPNVGWNDAEAGEPNNDEYERAFAIEDVGRYGLVYRVSVDDGRTWAWCDTTGSDDGFDPADVGDLVVRDAVDPCEGVVCDAPPAPSCADDGLTLQVPAEVGGCDEGACDYPVEEVDCAADGLVCVEGRCAVEGAEDNPRAPGEVLITEILYDPHGDLEDANAEWFELHNTTDRVVDLVACVVGSNSGSEELGNLAIEPGGYALFARSADPDLNGGLAPDQVFGFALGNGGTTLALRCGELLVDQVAYDVGGAFPEARRHSIALDPEARDADANDVGGNWCRGRTEFFAGHYGTPGAANGDCDVPVGWCRLQFPLEIGVEIGEATTVYGRFYAEGVTDRTAENDPFPLTVAELGYGPDGVDPEGSDEWTWQVAEPNPGWNGFDFDEPNNDEWQRELVAPALGAWDYTFRFSVDDGRTWRYCDADGTDNGYAAEQAGALMVGAAACEPNPCNDPPAPSCDDANTLRVYAGQGVCEVVGGEGQCTYEPLLVDCACVDGACPDAVRAPVAGEVLFSEIMYDPHFDIADARGEWLELRNTTGDALDLTGCQLADGSGSSVPIVDVRIGPNGYALFARSAAPEDNGGLDVDGTFPFALGNGGDVVRFACRGEILDEVLWGDGWPSQQAASLSLDPGVVDPAGNDDPANWCLGSTPYYEDPDGDNLGTPGGPNPACE